MRSIPGRDWRSMLMILCMYGFIFAFYDVYGGTFFPLFMLCLTYFILIRFIKRYMKENVVILRHQLTIMRSVLRLHPRGSPVLRNFNTLSYAQKILPGLLLANLIITLFDMTRAVHGQPEWFSHALHAVWMVVAVLYVYVVFRLRGPLLWNAVTVEEVQNRARRAIPGI